MIITEYYKTRQDGVRLERTYSDAGVMIRNTTTDAMYEEVINPVGSGRVYEETNVVINPGDPPENLNDSIEYLVAGRLIAVPEPEADPDYLNECEPEPEYFE